MKIKDCYAICFVHVFRLERLDHLAQKFRHRCDIHEEWAEGKEGMLESQDFKRCRLNDVKVHIGSFVWLSTRPYFD